MRILTGADVRQALSMDQAVQTAWVYDLLPEKADALAAEMAGRGSIPRDIRPGTHINAVGSYQPDVREIPTARQPLFADTDIRPGTHINAVGSYQPDVREIPTETPGRNRLEVKTPNR